MDCPSSKFALLIPLILYTMPAIAQWHGPNAPDLLSFQGFITDSSGVALDTAADITFKLYKGSNEIWSQTKAGTVVSNGVFNVILGGVGDASLDTVAFNEPIDLEIKYGNIVLTPRTPLTSAAYALGMRGMYAVQAEKGGLIAPNLIGGASNNFVANGVIGATIGGGGGWTNSGATSHPDSVMGDWGTVSGGVANRSGQGAAVGGGSSNSAAGTFSVVAGGQANSASGFTASVGGGSSNSATGSGSTIAGGTSNTASIGGSTVAGGQANNASHTFSSVGGGVNNQAVADHATVAGGLANSAAGERSTVAGGWANEASGAYASVVGGFFNAARGEGSFAGGYKARANHEGSFVWNDRSITADNDSLVSTDNNQFLIRASGGVGINTNSPFKPLTIQCPLPSCQWLGFRDDSGTSQWHINYDGGFNFVESGVAEYRLFLEDGGFVGIGTNNPKKNLHVNGDIYARGHVFLYSYGGDGTGGIAYLQARDDTDTTSIGLTLRTTEGGAVRDAIVMAPNGDVAIAGSLSKGSGTFKIDHPLDPENKYLYHSFVESPDMMNVYNGNVALDDTGVATVELPSYFEALNKDFRYQLTAIGAPGPNLYVADKISGNRFSIAGGSPGMEVSWQITGIRKDPYAEHNRIQVEVEKPAGERGGYLHPDAYAGTN
jgi:hypothetical protein